MVMVMSVINGFQLEGCFQGHSIYNNKYIFIIIYTMRHFLSKMLNDTHDHDTRDHCKNLEKNQKKIIDRNGDVVPLQMETTGVS